jgi:MFS family permease
MDNLGAVIGPLIAAGLLALGFTLREVFFWAIVPAVVVVVLTLCVREPERAVLKPKPFRWNLSDQPRAFRRYLLALSLFTLGNSSNMFLLLRARELGLGEAQVPLIWALVCFIAAAFGPALSAWSDRIDRRRLIVGGWSVYAVFYLVFGLLPAQPWLLWPLFAGYGIFLAATEGAEKALVADLVPGEQAGTAFGWYNLVTGITLLPASLLFGWLWADVAPLAAFAFGSACAVGAAGMMFRVGTGDKKPAVSR